MRFFIEAELKENPMIPYDQVNELAVKFLHQTIEQKKEGKILFNAIAAGKRLAFYIVEVESNEELEILMFSWALYNISNFRVIPLVSHEFRLDSLPKK
jgi:muconolactone delta-isomerase